MQWKLSFGLFGFWIFMLLSTLNTMQKCIIKWDPPPWYNCSLCPCSTSQFSPSLLYFFALWTCMTRTWTAKKKNYLVVYKFHNHSIMRGSSNHAIHISSQHRLVDTNWNTNYLLSEMFMVLNDQEFPNILLVSDWPRPHLLNCNLEWVYP